MTRLLSLLTFAALAFAVLAVPQADPLRLAALEAGNLLTEEVLSAEPVGSDDGGTRPPLLWELLARELQLANAGGPLVLPVGGSRLTIVEGVADPALHGEVRRSVIRRLRSLSADSENAALAGLEILGREVGIPDGIDIRCSVRHDTLTLAFHTPSGALMEVEKEWRPPNRSSLFPPLVAIMLAILFRRPVVALFSGVLAGAFLEQFNAGHDVVDSAFSGFRHVFDQYFVAELTDQFRYEIALFVVLMLAMVGVITRAGGIHGLMEHIARLAHSARRTQIAANLMGLAVFFDDYANTILVGSTMRPLTDRFKISREKLAYIVDSTAAPVAGLSIFSTWIAFEVSTFSAQLPDVGLAQTDGYSVFIQTLPYRFYCILTLVFVMMVAVSGRDFGPMLTAERRARGGQLLREGAQPMVGGAHTDLEPAPGVRPRALVAIVPLLTFIFVTLFLIAKDGNAFELGPELFTLEGLTQVLHSGSGSSPLMLGSLAGLVLAALLAFLVGLRGEILRAAWTAVRSMGVALVILFLAWMIGAVCVTLGTAPYLTVLLGDAVPAIIVPCVLFVLSGIVAFSTGSSWSTMSILLPLVVGFAYSVGEASPIGGHMLMIISIGAVLEGSIFGDHCSPISDTTVMSSIASASDHIDHVRTQAPYALMTMLIALLVGYFPCTFIGLDPFVALGVSILIMAAILFIYGRKSDAEPATTS